MKTTVTKAGIKKTMEEMKRVDTSATTVFVLPAIYKQFEAEIRDRYSHQYPGCKVYFQ